MNNKQKLHQIKLNQWGEHFQEQAASGLTVKARCEENNITIHTYNYWKHKLKLEYLDSLLPSEYDIVALPPNLLPTPTSVRAQFPDTTPLCQLRDSCKSHDIPHTDSICITMGDIRISADPSVSEEKLLQILKVMRHA